MSAIDGEYTLTLDTREGHAKAEVWRTGHKLPDGEAAAILTYAGGLIATAHQDEEPTTHLPAEGQPQ
jgi:hypothetical protein